MNQGESAASKARGLRGQAMAAQAEAGRLAQDAAAWEAGAEGERRVAKALSVLTAAFNVVVMHDRLLRPGRLRQTWITSSSHPPEFTSSTPRTGQGTSPSTKVRCGGTRLTAKEAVQASA